MILSILILAFVTAQRLGELVLARRNTRRLMARGDELRQTFQAFEEERRGRAEKIVAIAETSKGEFFSASADVIVTLAACIEDLT